jgi:hypothetical protein
MEAPGCNAQVSRCIAQNQELALKYFFCSRDFSQHIENT